MGSAFFHIEAGDECSLGYTFANNASSNIEFNQELATKLNNSDTLRILGIFENNGTVLRKVYDFKIENGTAVRLDSLSECVLNSSPYGKKSITIVNDVQIEESDKLIFEENFETSDSLSKFRKEVRSRVNAVNREFVAFMDNNITCKIENDVLNITAVLNQDTIFNVSDICTAKKDKLYDQQCKMYKIAAIPLPALYSAFLSSKFTFKYGRVNIRAQLPEGDYLFPCKYNVYFLSNFYTVLIERITDLILQNLESESDYASHIRIAFSRGNTKLKVEKKHYKKKEVIYGGVYLKNEKYSLTPYEVKMSLKLSAYVWSGGFHIYSIIWRKNIIIFLVDNLPYGWITNKSVLEALSEKEV